MSVRVPEMLVYNVSIHLEEFKHVKGQPVSSYNDLAKVYQWKAPHVCSAFNCSGNVAFTSI